MISDEDSGNKRLLPQKILPMSDAGEDDENSEIEYESEYESDENRKGKKYQICNNQKLK